jgi:hypothetical protein
MGSDKRRKRSISSAEIELLRERLCKAGAHYHRGLVLMDGSEAIDRQQCQLEAERESLAAVMDFVRPYVETGHLNPLLALHSAICDDEMTRQREILEEGAAAGHPQQRSFRMLRLAMACAAVDHCLRARASPRIKLREALEIVAPHLKLEGMTPKKLGNWRRTMRRSDRLPAQVIAFYRRCIADGKSDSALAADALLTSLDPIFHRDLHG